MILKTSIHLSEKYDIMYIVVSILYYQIRYSVQTICEIAFQTTAHSLQDLIRPTRIYIRNKSNYIMKAWHFRSLYILFFDVTSRNIDFFVVCRSTAK